MHNRIHLCVLRGQDVLHLSCQELVKFLIKDDFSATSSHGRVLHHLLEGFAAEIVEGKNGIEWKTQKISLNLVTVEHNRAAT